MSTQRFNVLKSRPKTVDVVAFDCEGVGGESGFVCGSVVSDREMVFFTSRVDMLRYLTGRQFAGSLIFAHNLDYDLALLSGGDMRLWELLYCDNRLITAKLHDANGRRWVFADSRNLFTSFSVDSLGQVVGVPKLKLPADIMDRLAHGARWSDFSREEQNAIRDYNIRDAEIVHRAVVWLRDELYALGGQLQTTISGCAMDVFRRRYLSTSWNTPDAWTNDLFRSAYYGARTEPYKVGRVPSLDIYDVNSLYPSVMATTSFPHPDYLRFEENPSSFSFIDRADGMAVCDVEIPDMYVPPLPVRVAKKLLFPVGRWRGAWTLLELRHALSHGVKLLSVDFAVYSLERFNPFADFVNDLFSRRQLFRRNNDERERIFKLLLNASYGRWGIRNDGNLQRLIAVPPDCDWEQFEGGQLVFYDGWPYVLQPIVTEHQPVYSCVPFAAQISAAARVRLHEYLMLSGDGLAYCDTDSVFTSVVLPTGDGLGQLRRDVHNVNVHIVSAKEYEYVRPDGQLVSHAKGVPRQLAHQYINGQRVMFERPVTIREAILRGDAPARWRVDGRARMESLPKRDIILSSPSARTWFPTVAWSPESLRAVIAGGFLPL